MASSRLSFPPGEAGLDTLRLECRFEAALAPADGSRAVTLVDTNFPDRVGWREVTAVGDGTTLTSSDVPTESPSDRLTSYPADQLQSPRDVRQAESSSSSPAARRRASSPHRRA